MTMQLVTRSGALNAGALNASPLAGPSWAMAEVVVEEPTSTVECTYTHHGGALNAGALNATKLAGSTIEETCVDVGGDTGPAQTETCTTVLRSLPGAINTSALNSSPLAGTRHTEETVCVPDEICTTTVTGTPGTLNGFALNSTALAGAQQIEETVCVPAACTTTVVVHPGTLNGFALNSTALAGVSRTTKTVCVPAGTSGEVCTTTVVVHPGTLNGFALNSTALAGARRTTETVCVPAGTGQEYSDTLESGFYGLGVVTQETVIQTLMAVAEGATFLIGSAGRSEDLLLTAEASEELDGVRGGTLTLEDYATGTGVFLALSRGQSETLEAAMGAADTFLSASRGGTYTFEDTAEGQVMYLLAGNTTFEQLEDTSVGAADIEGVKGQYDTLTLEASMAETLTAQLAAVGYIEDTARLRFELVSDAFVRIIKDFIDVVAAGSEVITGNTAAYTVLQDVAVGGAYILDTNARTAWVFNVQTGAMSTYEKFEAQAPIRADNEVLVATSTGVAKYEVTNSARAEVRFGASELGNPNLKNARHVYITAASSEPLSVLARAGAGAAFNEVEYSRPIDDSSVPRTYRLDLLKGELSTLWGFKLVAPEGANATILDQRVIVLVNKRRV